VQQSDGSGSSQASSRRNFDLLLGRKTYEIFAAYWPYYDEGAPHGNITKLFKDIKKYAVSRSGDVDTNWAGSVLLRERTGLNPIQRGTDRPRPCNIRESVNGNCRQIRRSGMRESP
jgi:hypothetical protein